MLSAVAGAVIVSKSPTEIEVPVKLKVPVVPDEANVIVPTVVLVVVSFIVNTVLAVAAVIKCAWLVQATPLIVCEVLLLLCPNAIVCATGLIASITACEAV